MSSLAIQPPHFVNKDELADALGVSKPTLDEMLKRYPGFPVQRRGTNGVPWQFDPEAVIAFVRAQREQEASTARERAALLDQFRLPIDAIAGDGATELTPAQRLAQARARKEERALAIETGLLVEAPRLRQALELAIAKAGHFLDQLVPQLAREFNLPEEVARSMRRRLDDMRRGFVDDIDQAFAHD